MNPFAFLGGSRALVDVVMEAAPTRAWNPLYQDRYPFVGGPQHDAGWVENYAGFKVEIVADDV